MRSSLLPTEEELNMLAARGEITRNKVNPSQEGELETTEEQDNESKEIVDKSEEVIEEVKSKEPTEEVKVEQPVEEVKVEQPVEEISSKKSKFNKKKKRKYY